MQFTASWSLAESRELTEDSQLFASRLIRRKAKQLVGKYGFTRSDRDDLEQHLWLRLLQRWQKFDPKKSHANAFITTVVERSVATLLTRRKAQKRKQQAHLGSLNVLVVDGEGEQVELARLVGQDHIDARRGRWTISDREGVELAHDVACAVARLSPNLGDLVERLKKGTVAEVARQLNVPRTTVQSAVRRLRRHFKKAGFEKIL